MAALPRILPLHFARAMLHDENIYPEPDKFNPERFLKNGYPDLSVRDPTTLAFGFGRR